MAAALNLALATFIITSVMKPPFTTDGSFCFVRNYHEPIDEKDSRTCAALWTYKQEEGLYVGHRPNCHVADVSHVTISMILDGDLQIYPRPFSKVTHAIRQFVEMRRQQPVWL